MSPWEKLDIDPWKVRPGNWKLRLNLGSGDRVFPTWTNHDKEQHSPYIDVAWDLNEIPWEPFADNTFSRVHAWAVLEHIRPTLMESMDEIWRILRPGGKVHIKVPHWTSDRARRDPSHIWHGWSYGVFTHFDATTKHGKAHHFYTPRKWELLERGYTDKKRAAIWAKLRKVCSLEQWEEAMPDDEEDAMGGGKGARLTSEPKRVIWVNARAGGGKSTLCRYLQSLYPGIIIVDDHNLWKDVFRHIYLKVSGEQTAVWDADWFEDERKESMHRDFAVECAMIANSLAQQGHRVIVDMIASPQKRRERIEGLCNPYWVYLRREKGEVRTPRFDKPEKCDLLIDNDELDKRRAAAFAAMKLNEAGMLP